MTSTGILFNGTIYYVVKDFLRLPLYKPGEMLMCGKAAYKHLMDSSLLFPIAD